MKFKEILNLAGTVTSMINPVVGLAIKGVNLFLPSDAQLPETATAGDVQNAYGTLSANDQLKLAEMDLQKVVEQGYTDRYKAMCEADGQETRAKVVIMCVKVLCAITLIYMGAIAYVYSVDGAKIAFSYEMAAVYLAISGTFAYVIRAYFGDLKTELESRHRVVNNQPAPLKGLQAIASAFNSMRK